MYHLNIVKKFVKKYMVFIFKIGTIYYRAERNARLKKFALVNQLVGYENQSTDILKLPNSSNRFEVVDLSYLDQISDFLEKNKQNKFFFYDIGCGSGISSIYVAKNLNFFKVIGVDLSSRLIEVARNNESKCKCVEIDFIQADASSFKLESIAAFIYLFNPFNDDVLNRFLENNIGILRDKKCYIYYVNAVHSHTIEKFNFKNILNVSHRTFESLFIEC